MLLLGFITYLVGLVLAGGPRSRTLNYLGTILAVLGLTICVTVLYDMEPYFD